MVTGDDRSALDWLWRWNLGGEGGITAALAGVSSPKCEGEEKVMSDPSWAQVSGPLAVHAGGSGLSWSGWGMRRGRAARHVLLMAHVSRWLAREGLGVAALASPAMDDFFAERRAAGYARMRTRRALELLVGYQRELGVVAPAAPVAPAGPADRLLAAYRVYLTAERGLTQTTADLNARLVRPFLADRAAARQGRLDLGDLSAGEVTAFVVAQSVQRRRPGASMRRRWWGAGRGGQRGRLRGAGLRGQ